MAVFLQRENTMKISDINLVWKRGKLLRALTSYYVNEDGFSRKEAFTRAYANTHALTKDELDMWVDAFCPS